MCQSTTERQKHVASGTPAEFLHVTAGFYVPLSKNKEITVKYLEFKSLQTNTKDFQPCRTEWFELSFIRTELQLETN